MFGGEMSIRPGVCVMAYIGLFRFQEKSCDFYQMYGIYVPIFM